MHFKKQIAMDVFLTNRTLLKADIANMALLTQEEQKNIEDNDYNVGLVNESMEVNPENIVPILIPVDSTSKLWKEWKAISQNVASFTFRRSPGRNCYFLIKNQFDNKNLGIIDVAADFLSLGERDKHIGWNKEQRKLRNRNIANISICVPTRIFGYELSGGKLLALLATSKQVANHWKEKYGDDLVGITVTSLYGRGCQYNRLPHFKYVGKTKGQGTCQIPESIYKRCRNLVEEVEGEIKGGCFTKGKNSRISIIRKACKHLGIDAKILTTHGRKRGIYWCSRGDNTKEFLKGETTVYNEKNYEAVALLKYWKDTWAYRRTKNLKTKREQELTPIKEEVNEKLGNNKIS